MKRKVISKFTVAICLLFLVSLVLSVQSLEAQTQGKLSGKVSVEHSGRVPSLPPVGRVLHVCQIAELAPVLGALAPHVTTAAVAGPPDLWQAVQTCVPHARVVAPGAMQRPPLDGPVDRRGAARLIGD